MTDARAQPKLSDAFPAVRSWLDGEPEASVPPSPADRLAELFGLDAFSRNVVLLAAYSALEPEAPRLIAGLHGGSGGAPPSVGLALARIPGAHWSAFAASAPLRAAGLIVTGGAEAIVSDPLRLPESVLFFLLGAPALSEELVLASRPVEPPGLLPPGREALARSIATWTAPGRAETVQLCGGDARGKELAAAAATARAGQRLFVMNATMIPASTGEVARFAQLWRRDLRLMNARLLIDAAALTDARPVALFAELAGGGLMIAAPEALNLGNSLSLRLEMPRPTAAEQLPMWERELGTLAARLNGSLARLAGHFTVSPELAGSVAAEARRALDEGGEPEPDLDRIAWDACRRFTRPSLDDLARRIDGRARWDDLVLPAAQIRTLEALAAQVRHRATVYESWGFAERSMGRGLGISALFCGPSGAGKTLAGEVLGAELELDVYRIDLSAIVSKWIGETEKNLRRVFDAAEEGCAILQFDEADALFGKRTEVKDSHDRHANVEVSYLLQRLEEYRGLSILTTNLKSNIDPAFLRRIRFIVDFPFPDPVERIAIWRGIFPAELPVEGLDFERLGQLNLSGGSIRNVALGAAFLAADAGAAVGMPHILAAARTEYAKTGRPMTAAELRGWPQ